MLKCDCNKVATKFIEIILRHEGSPVNLLHIFRTPFSKSTSGRLLLLIEKDYIQTAPFHLMNLFKEYFIIS